MINNTLNTEEFQETNSPQKQFPEIPEQQPNALAIFKKEKGKFPDRVKSYLKKNFEAHWLNNPESFSASFYSLPIKYELFAKPYLTKENVKFDLLPIRDPYFEKSEVGRKIDRLEQVKGFKFREFMDQTSHFFELLKSLNELFEINITKTDIETNSAAVRTIFEGENQRLIDCLQIVTDRLNDASEKSTDLLDMDEKIKQVSKEELILNPKSPLQSAEKLLKKQFIHNGDKIIHFCGDAFWKWNGPCYEEVHPNEMRKFTYTFLDGAKRTQIDEGNIVLTDFDPNQTKVNNVLDAFKAINHCNLVPESGPSWLSDEDSPSVKDMLVFRNGMLDIRSWLNNPETPLTPHTPLFLNSSFLPFDFNPNAEEPVEWLNFLRSLWEKDQQSINTLQEQFGYILSNDTRLQKIFMLVGLPRSGKGTIARILRSVVGEKNSISPSLSSLSEPFGLQPWLAKQLAIITDARVDVKSNHSIIAERLLNISGEDSITINRKNRLHITTTLPTRIMVISNELPNIKDSSGALANRFIILSLTKSWLGKEDLDLEIRIRPELPGILLWALRGLKRLRERKRFVQPESALQHFEDLMAMSSSIKAFINDRCELGPTKWIEINSLFGAWKKWCEDTGHDKPGTIHVFGRNLRTAAPQIRRTRPRTKNDVSRTKNDVSRTRIRIYEGIGLLILSNN